MNSFICLYDHIKKHLPYKKAVRFGYFNDVLHLSCLRWTFVLLVFFESEMQRSSTIEVIHHVWIFWFWSYFLVIFFGWTVSIAIHSLVEPFVQPCSNWLNGLPSYVMFCWAVPLAGTVEIGTTIIVSLKYLVPFMTARKALKTILFKQ